VNAPLSVFVGETVPHPGEQATPACVRLQVTPAFETSFKTVATNPSSVPVARVSELGEIETEIDSGGGVIVRAAEAN
jgi:hypothetical protein